jgi:hypothetical protein
MFRPHFHENIVSLVFWLRLRLHDEHRGDVVLDQESFEIQLKDDPVYDKRTMGEYLFLSLTEMYNEDEIEVGLILSITSEPNMLRFAHGSAPPNDIYSNFFDVACPKMSICIFISGIHTLGERIMITRCESALPSPPKTPKSNETHSLIRRKQTIIRSAKLKDINTYSIHKIY